MANTGHYRIPLSLVSVRCPSTCSYLAVRRGPNRDPGPRMRRGAVDPHADGGEGDAPGTELIGEAQAGAIRIGKQGRLVVAAPAPDGNPAAADLIDLAKQPGNVGRETPQIRAKGLEKPPRGIDAGEALWGV